MIENETFNLIIDSGASCCILDKRHLTENLYTSINSAQTIRVHGISGVTSTVGTVKTFIQFNGYEYPIIFHIIEGLPPNIQGIIGTNFLKKFSAKIDFDTSRLYLRSPLFEENFLIPPRTKVITFVEVDYSEPMVILNQEIQPKIFIAGAIVEPKNGEIPVRLLNIKNKAVKMEKIKPELKPFSNYDIIKIGSADKHDPVRAQKILSELKLDGLNGKDRPIIENDIFA